jgi:hypothetical protein
MRFAYRPALTVSPGGMTYILRPIIPVLILGPQGSDLVFALVDTGSDECLFPRTLVPSLGVTVDDSQAIPFSGMSGSPLMASPGQVELEIADGTETYRWPAPVRFVSAGALSSPAILGHAGFLDFFLAAFDGQRKELVLTTNALFPGAVRRP